MFYFVKVFGGADGLFKLSGPLFACGAGLSVVTRQRAAVRDLCSSPSTDTTVSSTASCSRFDVRKTRSGLLEVLLIGCAGSSRPARRAPPCVRCSSRQDQVVCPGDGETAPPRGRQEPSRFPLHKRAIISPLNTDQGRQGTYTSASPPCRNPTHTAAAPATAHTHTRTRKGAISAPPSLQSIHAHCCSLLLSPIHPAHCCCRCRSSL